jgi:hypothetical protein
VRDEVRLGYSGLTRTPRRLARVAQAETGRSDDVGGVVNRAQEAALRRRVRTMTINNLQALIGYVFFLLGFFLLVVGLILGETAK